LSTAATDNNPSTNNGTYQRSVCIDKLEYNTDGTIKKVIRTTTGVPIIPVTRAITPLPENSSGVDRSVFNIQKRSEGIFSIVSNNATVQHGKAFVEVFTLSGKMEQRIFVNNSTTELVLKRGSYMVCFNDAGCRYSQLVVSY